MSETKRLSVKQEKALARATTGQVSSGSGSGWLRKSDVRSDNHLWEAKRTDGKSISIKLDDWIKNRRYAWEQGRTPAMHLEIGTTRLVVLEEDDFLELIADDPS